jgi:5-methyltetrahydropteroyltriglutamate--homocysteine methyltransferase
VKRSVDRILTTHTGSLPRPPDLVPLLFAREAGQGDAAALAGRVREAVAEVVGQQAGAGVDVLNDGEMGKIGYSTYVTSRLTGFGGEPVALTVGDMTDFPEYMQRMYSELGTSADAFQMPTAVGDVRVKDHTAVQADIDNLRAATQGVQAEDVFMSAASPGVIALFLPNRYYPTREAYLAALTTWTWS